MTEKFKSELDLFLALHLCNGVSTHDIACILQEFVEKYEKLSHDEIKKQRQRHAKITFILNRINELDKNQH